MKQSETKVLPSEVKNYLAQGYKLVDIREKSELVDTPKLDQAINLPLSTLIANPEQYLKPDDKLLLVCRSGNRSSMLKKKLSDAGYQDVLDVDGGMNELSKIK